MKVVLSRVGESLVGFAPDQASADAARRLWESGAGRAEVMRAWPFFGSAAFADALERGDEVEAGWLAAYENPGRLQPPLERLHGFVELAMREPRLRGLGAGIRLGVRGLSFRDLDGVYVDGGQAPSEEVWTVVKEIDHRRVVGHYRVLTDHRRTLGEGDAATALSLMRESLDLTPEPD